MCYTGVAFPRTLMTFYSISQLATSREGESEMELQPKIRLLDRVRQAIRLKNYAYSTEKAYVYWIKRFILFHKKRHPKTMGGPEIETFLSYLAVERNVSASTHTVPASFQGEPGFLCTVIPIQGSIRSRIRFPHCFRPSQTS